MGQPMAFGTKSVSFPIPIPQLEPGVISPSPCILQILTCEFLSISLSIDFDANLVAYSFFQWQDILQVIIPRSSALAAAAAGGAGNPSHEEWYTTCPICLSPPTAPRMTKCGHVSLVRHTPSHLLTIAFRSSVFRAYCIISARRRIQSGLVVRFVSTL
jgi:hypothetical protein